MKIVERPSPNHGDRRGHAPSLIVLHYTAMASAEAAIERLCAEEFQVSAHYLIARDGAITRMVEEGRRAWHAGAGSWRGIEDVNSHSIGIELDNDGASPFPLPQMRALDDLLRDVRGRWGIPKENVIGHSDLAPGRKSDPGPLFDWARLEAQGHAVRVPEGADMDGDFRVLAQAAGYTAEVAEEVILDALRLRHRIDARGTDLDGRDLFIARWLGDRTARRGSKDILDTYRRQATHFDARRGRSGIERVWLDRFRAMMDGTEVLDLGCGAGEPIASWFVAQGMRVTGVDGAAPMLALARERMPEQIWIEADMRGLELGRRFDGIVAWNSFFHLDPAAQRAMFATFAAHARPGAPLLFTCGPADGEAWGQVGPEEVYHASLSPEEYRTALDQAGFDVVDFVPEDPECDRHTVCLARYRGG